MKNAPVNASSPARPAMPPGLPLGRRIRTDFLVPQYSKPQLPCTRSRKRSLACVASGTSGTVIGIDLGTSNSAVAVIQDGSPVVIPLEPSRRTIPSILHFNKVTRTPTVSILNSYMSVSSLNSQNLADYWLLVCVSTCVFQYCHGVSTRVSASILV